MLGSGLPHYGHLLASTIKDIIPRYWSMKGYHVQRRFGWDTHGVPIEHEIDKKLGISGKDMVMKFGLGNYNAECRNIVMRFAAEWRTTIDRLGRWIDFDNDYKVDVRSLFLVSLLIHNRQWIQHTWSRSGGSSRRSTKRTPCIEATELCHTLQCLQQH